MKFTNKVYDSIKNFTVSIPWAAGIYYILSLEFPDKFSYGVTIMFGALFLMCLLNLLLAVSRLNYKGDGTLQIDTSDEEKDIYRLVYNEDPEGLKDQEFVIFKVEKTKLG